MPTICLTMIVKDEGHLIRDTLKHLLTYIRFDSWCICDTGSTDNTIFEIEDFFAKEGIPGSIYRHEWKDFGHNRTLAFEAAYNTSDYAFVWDADDEIVGDFKLPQNMTADWYKFTFGARGCTQYRRCQLFNNRKKWKYVGVLHECPACVETCGPSVDVFGDYHFVSGRRGARSKDPQKYLKDALILDKAFEESFAAKDGLYKRYAFYCGNSYVSAGQREKSIPFYKKVLSFDTWCQEQYIACIELFDTYEQLGKPEEGLFYLVESFRYDSQRAECVLRLVKYYINRGMPQVALMYYRGIQEYYENKYEHDPIEDKLFVRRCDADFYLPYYMIIAAERSKKLDISATMFTAILKYKYLNVTDWWLQNLFHNLQFFISHIPRTVAYATGLCSYIDLIHSKGFRLQDSQYATLYSYLTSCTPAFAAPSTFLTSHRPVRILLTMTTCKRIDLFRKTVNSMLATWTDLSMVDSFFCVDDCSSREDRVAMQEEFPFFDYYMKSPAERGHRASMNIIWQKLQEQRPEFWIHLEDDWLFVRKDSYVANSVKFLTKYKDANIHQILFNRNYAETYTDWSIMGGIPLEPGFFLHDTNTVPGKSCAYWKHYSFRPSMIRVETILSLGDYTTPNTFFEGDYAKRYADKGFKSAFFDTISCLHIGKLTSDKKGVNAYTLNNTAQFKQSQNTYVVNLTRRPDRKHAIGELFEKTGIDSYSFFPAVDGNSLVVTEEIVKLFTGNDFRNRRGFIGCALSHYTLWKQLLADTANEYYIVYEDDITLTDDYCNKLAKVVANIAGKDLIYLGYTMIGSRDERVVDTGIVPCDLHKYIGGTFGYIITKSGCKKLLDYIEKNGIKHGIDYVMKICTGLHIYNAQPHLVFSEWVEGASSKGDSDIQKDYTGLELVVSDWKKDWIYHDAVDSPDYDIMQVPGVSLHALAIKAASIQGCVGFNTLGFLKSKVGGFTKTPYINSPGRGIYVKRQPTDSTIRVKMLCNWCSSEDLCKEWKNMSQGDNRWNSIQLTSGDDCDYYVIINKPREGAFFIPEKTVIFHMEPWCGDEAQKWGVKTWGEWARPDPSKFLQVRSHDRFLNTGFWQINKTYTELKECVVKDQVLGSIISSVCSSKYFDPGHIKRIDFMKFIEAKWDSHVQLHIYNEDNKHGFASYQGKARPFVDKERGILPYKYYFMCENNVEKNFITEKLWEPILCESLCFYWGCPNVSDYINPLAYVQLDMNDFEGSFQIVKAAIQDNLWEKRLDILREEKKKILDTYNFFPTLERVLKGRAVCFIHSCHLEQSGTECLDLLLQHVLAIQEIDTIYINNIGLPLPSKYTDPRIQIHHESDDTTMFELPTLRRISEFSKKFPDSKVLYLHTKGVSYGKSHSQYNNVIDWVNYMLYFLCSKKEQCLNLLQSYDAVGCDRVSTPRNHYSGNFWWATTNYIRGLSVETLKIKHDAEWWILSGECKSYEMFPNTHDRYIHPTPRETYVEKELVTA